MALFGKDKQNEQAGAKRPSVADARVARPQTPQLQQRAETLQPSDSFDLGDVSLEAPKPASGKKKSLKARVAKPKAKGKAKAAAQAKQASEAQAGEWLAQKAASASAKKAGGAVPSTGQTAVMPAAPVAGQPAPDAPVQAAQAQATASDPAVSAASEARDAGSRPSLKGKAAAVARDKEKVRAIRKRVLTVVGIVVGVLLVLAIAAGAFWVWNEWFRYDDTADIQGTWIDANGQTVTIDETCLHMPDAIDFEYSMDTKEKTIAYEFGQMSGGGSYDFSDDRNTLVITEADGSQTTLSREVPLSETTEATAEGTDAAAEEAVEEGPAEEAAVEEAAVSDVPAEGEGA